MGAKTSLNPCNSSHLTQQTCNPTSQDWGVWEGSWRWIRREGEGGGDGEGGFWCISVYVQFELRFELASSQSLPLCLNHSTSRAPKDWKNKCGCEKCVMLLSKSDDWKCLHKYKRKISLWVYIDTALEKTVLVSDAICKIIEPYGFTEGVERAISLIHLGCT